MFGAIEAGGTKFVCAVSDEDLNIIEKITIPTTHPEETFAEVFKFFDQYELEAIGIGSFGPIDVNPESKTYGYITSTPKRLWRETDFLGAFKERYQIPIGWNTDVNAAALGEVTLGAAKDKKSCVYITVGTGVGGGAVINGEPLTGFGHPEMGHIYLPRHEKDSYEGFCDYHGNCLEGLAAGPAIEGRFGIRAENLPEDHEAWEIEAHYLAHAVMSYTMTLSPDCIIFGGGVMQQSHLFPLIREKFREILGEYVNLPALDEYIIPTGLGNESGILGSLLLAKQALN
jgi:fructokinase